MKEKLVSRVIQTSLSGKLGKIESIRKKNILRTGCRVYKDGKIGIAGALGQVNEDELFAKAEGCLKYAIPYNAEPTGNLKKEFDMARFSIQDKELLQKTEEILEALGQSHPDFLCTPKAVLNQREFKISNEIGLDLSYKDSYLDFSILFKEKTSNGILDAYIGLAERSFEPEKILQASRETLDAYTNKVELDTTLPVIISQDTVNRVFYRDLNGKLVGNKASLLADKIGMEAFNKNVSLKLETDPEETLYRPFDAEGTIVSEELSFLIKDGKILRPFTDKQTAKKFDYENTGCGESSYDGVPSLSARPLTLVPSNKSLKELLNGQKGIYIGIASGGDFTPDGTYASPVQVAMIFDGEKLVGRIPEITIKGSIFDIYGKNFVGLSSDKHLFAGNERLLVTKMAIEKLEV